MADTDQLHKNEHLKQASNYLRGTILEGLADTSTGSISADDQQLTKFHGIYQQDDRDLRKERRKAKLEKAFSFMIRVRVPGGVSTPAQWLEMDRLSREYANHTLKLTTRQAYQLHGVVKSDLKKTIAEINGALMDTIAACGDVNRNVMCNPNPTTPVHAAVLDIAQKISDHLTPQTGAYHEIWLTDEDGEKVKVTEDPKVIEPIYGETYLPRKFKTVVAVPPSNDVDIFAHDLGYIAIVEDDKVVGYNVTVGGGMGMHHGNEATFPRLADVMGYCTPEQAVEVSEAVVKVQRDHGDRTERKHARLKYTIEDHGIDWFRDEVEKRLGYKLEAARDFKFEDNGDRYGWTESADGQQHLTLFIQNGRVLDKEGWTALTALREVAKIHKGDFRLTANQNLIIADVAPADKAAIEAILAEHGLGESWHQSGMRLNSMACVALPTCGLALAESERYLPDLITEFDEVLKANGLEDDAITIRMTGCPNGCARPYIAEIALVGRGPGKYNLYLGGGFVGDRIVKMYRDRIAAEEIVPTMKPIIEAYAKERTPGEKFGDFCIRTGVVVETREGRDFHKDFAECS